MWRAGAPRRAGPRARGDGPRLGAAATQRHHGKDLGDDALGGQAGQAATPAGGQAGGHRRRSGGADRPGGGHTGRAGRPAAAHAPDRQRTTSGDRRATARAGAAQRDDAAAADGEAEDRRLQAGGRHQRQDHRERRALSAHVALELRAGGTAVDVGAHDAAPRHPPGDGRELLADLGAWRLARRARAQQRLARLEDEGLDLLPAHAEDGRDLLVGLVAELEEDQRGALVIGQALQLGHQLAQVGAPLDVGGHALDRPGAVRDRVDGDLGAACTQRRQAPVAGDRVQPRAQVDVAAAAHAAPGTPRRSCAAGRPPPPGDCPASARRRRAARGSSGRR